jgi:ubiquinone/menaquinone biosynthesis C-methylase UbiE
MTSEPPSRTDQVSESAAPSTPVVSAAAGRRVPPQPRRSRAHGGDVLEVGVGTGRNLPYFSPDIRLTGIDISPAMIELARRRADEPRRGVELRVGDAEALAFPDGSFDTVVFCLTLCSVPDDRRAMAEARRVLRPAGRVALFEHVRSPVPIIRVAQRLLDPLAVRFQADHLMREPAEVLPIEGFTIDVLERSRLGYVERLIAHNTS